jgi:hypothetical protein
MPKTDQPELWIGVVEVKPLDRKAYGDAGAFTNIVTWATDQEAFMQKAETIAATLDMYVREVERMEPLVQRRKNRTLTDEIEDMALRAESNPRAIVWKTFHRYPHDEA